MQNNRSHAIQVVSYRQQPYVFVDTYCSPIFARGLQDMSTIMLYSLFDYKLESLRRDMERKGLRSKRRILVYRQDSESIL